MRFLQTHGEPLFAAALFVLSVFGVVFFTRRGSYGNAGYALFCAVGFFHALMSFLDAAELRGRIRRMRQEQRAQGLDG